MGVGAGRDYSEETGDIMIVDLPPRRLSIHLAVAMAVTLSFAQSVEAEVTRDTIVVTAPRLVGRSTAGSPVELITVARYVSYQGLNLRTTAGVAELNTRIANAAHEQCEELESKYPIGQPEAAECARTAIGDAQYQVHAAIRETIGG
jgi:UrcA family protein